MPHNEPKKLSLASRMGEMGEEMDFCPPMAPELNDLLDFVRRNSPYYRELWKNVPDDGSAQLHRYPVVDPAPYWAANTCSGSSVLTGPLFSGVVLRSGGTVKEPRMTCYTKDELRMASQQIGTGIVAAGIRAHDRIANLFDSGDMCGSFLLHALSITDLTLPLVHLPIGGSSSPETIAQYMRQSSATVVFATVSTLVKLAEFLIASNETMPQVRALMFCGEPFYEDQRERVLDVFPCARIRSLLYGSLDAGVVGYSTSLFDSRQHTVSAPYVVLEIVPYGTTPTTENGVPGRVVVTNLGRRLQPVIRYPTGDRAEWVDYANGKFRILGKDVPGVLIGSSVVNTTRLRDIVLEALGLGLELLELPAFQVRITRENLRDVVTLRVGHKPVDEGLMRNHILTGLHEAEPILDEDIAKGVVAPLRIEFVEVEELKLTRGRGARKAVVDVVDERYVI